MILTLCDGDRTFKSDLLVLDDRIKLIQKNIKVTSDIDRVIDCTNKLLMPSFKNAHGHSAMNFARNIADNLPLESWLNEIIFPMERYFDEHPEVLYDLVKMGIVEYLESGITAVFEMYQYPKYYEKVFSDVGFRANILLMADEWMDNPNFDYSLFNAKNEFVNYKFGIHAIFTQSEERLLKASEIVKKYKIPFYLHLAETKDEVNYCLTHFGLTPVKYLDSLGLLNYGGGFFHSIYISDEEMDIIKKHNIDVISCPSSNAKLIDGVCPIAKYLAKNIRVSLGSDSVASNNSLDMFKEMYLGSVLQKLKENDPKAGEPLEILKMATSHPARLMGLENADVIEENKKADLILIDLNRPAMIQSGSIANALVYSGSKDLIYLTMINGKILYENKKFYLDEDVNALFSRVKKIHQDIIEYSKIKISI